MPRRFAAFPLELALRPSQLRASAACDRGGSLVEDVGPGNDWRCVVSWHLPGVDAATWLSPEEEAELRERLRQAYLPEWASFGSPGRLVRAWELAVPLGALHQAVSYRSLAAQPPGDPHMAQSTAWWLRQVLAGQG